jgi:peptide/nickel transport system substrate-binding protein
MMRAERLRSTRQSVRRPRATPVRLVARALDALTLRAALALGAAACGSVALGACTGSARPTDTIVIASGSDLESANPVVTLHPLSRQVQRHMLFVPLVHLDSALQPVPALARRWQWSDDGTTLTFTLRTDVRWHDDAPTTAEDVRFTFDAVRDPDTGSPRAGDLNAVVSLAAPDDTTFVVRFGAAPAGLPLIFAELPPVPAHLLRDVPRSAWRGAAFATNPIGNGPFRFASRTPGARWRFVRNEAFPSDLGGPPWAREVVIAVVDEPSTKLAGLVSGDLDVAGVSPSMADLVTRDPLLVLETPPVLFTTVLAFNTGKPPFDDVRVRRAIALGIDRARIVDAAVAGYGVPSRRVVPPGVFTDAPGAPPAAIDTAEAARLLDAAGWRRGTGGQRTRDGVALALTLLTAGSGELAAEQLLQDDLRRLGFAVDIRTTELATFLSLLRAEPKTFDVAYTGIPGDLALGHLRALLDGRQRGGGLAYTAFANDTLDAALDRALAADAPQARAQAWQRVDSLVEQFAPVSVVYHARGVQGRARSLDGVVMDLRGELATVSRWRRRDDGAP